MGRGPCAGSLCALLFCTALAGEAPCALSPEELPLAARTARATAHCDIVLFSAAYFGADAALDEPRSRHHRALGNRTCAVLAVGPGTAEALAHHCSVAPWTVVADESATARDRPRRASKRVKLSASLYFPTAAFTLFVDWKYALLQTPEWFLERTAFRAPSRVSLFAHPCSAATSAALQGPFAATCAHPRRPGEAWEAWEARLILDAARTDEPGRLRAQVARMSGAGGADAYADSAVVAAAHADSAVFDRDDSSDRDQLAFAAAFRASPHGVGLIEPGDSGAPCAGHLGRCEALRVLRSRAKVLPPAAPRRRRPCRARWLDDPRHALSGPLRGRIAGHLHLGPGRERTRTGADG
ncbi:GTPase [Aureococcus anophagefferens]|nr:GTPase [Aureococcus anophagefferens]